MERKRIMIVDDEEGFLEELKETLVLSGYDTVDFNSGESALEKVRMVKPDAILVDLKMGGKSGFQVAVELNSSPETAQIPIIAMTAHYTEKEHARLMNECGIKKCILKPFNPLDVIFELERFLK
jgi:two-component system, OmpR family, alkaline phosphatase synthesis response regulator PhoP